MPPNRSRDKFEVGQRVCASTKGVNNGAVRSGQLGTVVGFGRESTSIVVCRDGIKTKATYHMSSWDHLLGDVGVGDRTGME